MKQSLKSELMKLKQQNNHPVKTSQETKKANVIQEKQQKMEKFLKPVQIQPTKTRMDIFYNITFCFPHFDVELTKKQAQYVSKKILMHGGHIIEYSEYLKNQPIQYVLVSSKARIQSILKKIEGHINYLDILDYNFIQCCVTEEKLLDHEAFSFLGSNEQEKKQRKNSVQSSGKRKRKGQENQKKQVSENQQKRSITQQLPPSDHQSDPQQRNFKKLDKDKFFCQAGKKEDKPAMNKFIEQELLELQKIYANQRDIGRRIAYGKAASLVRTWKEEIKTEQDVDKIPGIGPKINKKIKEIVTTGKLKKLQELNQSQEVVAMGELSKVWGIGPAKAKQLYKQGIKSIQQLRKNQSSLTRNQKIGLKYFEDFEKRIPRQKVQKMYEVVRKTLSQVTKSPQAYKSQVCGSFRRGKQTCGDMDIIITRKDGVFGKDLLVKLVAQLQKIGFLTDNLSQPKCGQGHVSTSYMGVCKYEDDTHHRIDIKHYPLQQYAFALLYFTGSGMFNRSMRLYATKLGLLLSDKGFQKRPYKNDVVWNKPIPICYNEQDVFKVLGLDYKTPQQRDD